MKNLTAIVALNHEGVIGCGNALPWRLKTDMRFFKDQTTGGVVLMGRKTFDSLHQRPLKARHNVVISHHFNLFAETETCKIASGIEDGLFRASLAPRLYKQAFVIGGASMYDQFAPFVDRYLITLVDKVVPDGDTFFCPAFDPSEWEKISLFAQSADVDNEASFTVFELRNRRSDEIKALRLQAIERARFASRAPLRESRPSSRKVEMGSADRNLAMF
jgi:dihydrofolate reductase